MSKVRFARVLLGELKRYYQKISQLSAVFTLVFDVVILTMGDQLNRKERLSGRLSNILSYLYIGSEVMKYYEFENEREMELVMRWVRESLLYHIEQEFNEFLVNLLHQGLARFLCSIVLLLGKQIKPPTNKLGEMDTELFLYLSQVRERLSKHVYIKKNTK